MFDLVIVGGGPAAISCGLILGSASQKPYMKNKKIGIIGFSKSSDLNPAIINNLFGIPLNTNGKELLEESMGYLKSFELIEQLDEELITSVTKTNDGYEIKSENNTYQAKNVVLAIGHSPKIAKIEGLEDYIIDHTLSLPGVSKKAIKNNNLVVEEGFYVAGLTSGCASQVAIAVGTGADVGVQLLTKWNNGIFDHYHDK